MKAAVARTVHRVDFGNKPAPRRDSAPAGRVPRVARMLALAHKIDEKIGAGELRDLADAARAIGVTRARMTQITNLLLLAPEIQTAILELPLVTTGRDPITERALRQMVVYSEWDKQFRIWQRLNDCEE